MYTLTVYIPNAPLLIQRTFRFDNANHADQVIEYCKKHNLKTRLHFTPAAPIDAVLNEIDEELALAAERRVA